MKCPIHPTSRGPGTKSCAKCREVHAANQRVVERNETAREVGMRPTNRNKFSYGLPLLNWPAPEKP